MSGEGCLYDIESDSANDKADLEDPPLRKTAGLTHVNVESNDRTQTERSRYFGHKHPENKIISIVYLDNMSIEGPGPIIFQATPRATANNQKA